MELHAMHGHIQSVQVGIKSGWGVKSPPIHMGMISFDFIWKIIQSKN